MFFMKWIKYIIVVLMKNIISVYITTQVFILTQQFSSCVLLDVKVESGSFMNVVIIFVLVMRKRENVELTNFFQRHSFQSLAV